MTKQVQIHNAMITSYDMTTYDDVPTESFCSAIQYCVGQRELCPSTDRRHWQLYVEFRKKLSVSSIKKIFGNEAHIEKRKKSQANCIDYCTRDNKREPGTEWSSAGIPKSPGVRNDRYGVVEARVNDESLDVMDRILYRKLIAEADAVLLEDKVVLERDIECEVYWGPTGTGKSHRAFTQNDSIFIPIVNRSGQVWWDGYRGQSCILLDDFGGEININLLKRLLDKWPFPCETKGGRTFGTYTKVIITSNRHPRDWYRLDGCQRDIDALIRRVKIIEFLDKFEA